MSQALVSRTWTPDQQRSDLALPLALRTGQFAGQPLKKRLPETPRRDRIFQAIFAAVALLPLALVLATAASAQAPYPNRNITLVLPFAAGSGTDTTTRIISKELGTALGVGMIIENKAGANGSIAASYIARSVPDG